jgi:serine kinase of HPr protein (carbohydrate metabolism regulator)
MQPETSGANTNTWLEASKKMKIKAYIESFMPTLSVSRNPYPNTDLYDALKNISVPISLQKVTDLEPQLEMEIRAWDTLSDEALIDFEQRL